MVNGTRSPIEDLKPPKPQDNEEWCECGAMAKWYCELWPWKKFPWSGCKRHDIKFSDDVDPSNRG